MVYKKAYNKLIKKEFYILHSYHDLNLNTCIVSNSKRLLQYSVNCSGVNCLLVSFSCAVSTLAFGISVPKRKKKYFSSYK